MKVPLTETKFYISKQKNYLFVRKYYFSKEVTKSRRKYYIKQKVLFV